MASTRTNQNGRSAQARPSARPSARTAVARPRSAPVRSAATPSRASTTRATSTPRAPRAPRAATSASSNGTATHGHGVGNTAATWTVKAGLAQMLKGGVIMDVVTAEHARIAEEAGACAVMALERVPSDIRAAGGVARMSHVKLIEEICRTVTIPVMAKVRIGHFVEAQILESIGVDYIDESEVLTPADDVHHIEKAPFKVPFVCGCRDLGEALRRIAEGAAMIRTKGEAGTGDIVEAVRHMRALWSGIRRVASARDEELPNIAKELGASLPLVLEVKRLGRLPVVNFSAGGIATPADAALMMQLGADGVFVGSGIFKSGEQDDPRKRVKEQAAMASAIVRAVTHYNDPAMLAEVSRGIGEPMRGQSVASIPLSEQLAGRGN